MSMFTRNRNRQIMEDRRKKFEEKQKSNRDSGKVPWLMLNPIEKYKRGRADYEKMMKRKNKVMQEMKKQRDMRKKRQEYIKSIDPNKGIKI